MLNCTEQKAIHIMDDKLRRSSVFSGLFLVTISESPVTVKMRIRHYFSGSSTAASYDLQPGGQEHQIGCEADIHQPPFVTVSVVTL